MEATEPCVHDGILAGAVIALGVIANRLKLGCANAGDVNWLREIQQSLIEPETPTSVAQSLIATCHKYGISLEVEDQMQTLIADGSIWRSLAEALAAHRNEVIEVLTGGGIPPIQKRVLIHEARVLPVTLSAEPRWGNANQNAAVIRGTDAHPFQRTSSAAREDDRPRNLYGANQ
jgi:hypothetical protein